VKTVSVKFDGAADSEAAAFADAKLVIDKMEK